MTLFLFLIFIFGLNEAHTFDTLATPVIGACTFMVGERRDRGELGNARSPLAIATPAAGTGNRRGRARMFGAAQGRAAIRDQTAGIEKILASTQGLRIRCSPGWRLAGVEGLEPPAPGFGDRQRL